MSLGEAFVQVKADTKGFERELLKGVGDAMRNLTRSVEGVARQLESIFGRTAQDANRSLAQVNGDKFRDAVQAADAAARDVQQAFDGAAGEADQALASVDGDEFDAVEAAADSAADDVTNAFEGAADIADAGLASIDGGGFDTVSGAADGAADDVVAAFDGAADTADAALSSMDGGGFPDVTGGAESAADEITGVFEGAADAIDGALSNLDAGGFASLTAAADSAATEIASLFDGTADAIQGSFDGALDSVDAGVRQSTAGGRQISARGVAGIAAVLGALKSGFGFVKAGEAANTANARIGQISKSMGLFGDETEDVTDRLVDFAAQQSRRTGADRNAIKEGQALLLTFKQIGASAGDAGGNFDRATIAAIDLAAAGFGSVTGNSVQLGKALNDPIKGMAALSRSGVTFTEVEKDLIKEMVAANRILEAQDFILSAIETQVGGTAEATMNSSDVMKESFAEVKETIGQALVPAFDLIALSLGQTVLPAISNTVRAFQEDWATAVDGGATRLGALRTVTIEAAGRVVERFGVSAEAAESFKDALNNVTDAIGTVASTIRSQLEGPLRRVGDLLRQNSEFVGILAASLGGAISVVFSIRTAMMAFAIAAKAVGIALAVMGGPVTLIIAAIAALVAGAILAYQRFEGFRDIVDGVVAAVVNFAEAAWPVLQAAFEGIVEAAQRVGDFLVDTWQRFQDIIDVVLPVVIGALASFWSWIDANFISTIRAGLDFVFALWNRLFPVIKAVVDNVINVLKVLIEFVKAFVKIITPIIQGWLEVVVTAFKIAFDIIWGVIKLVFNTIKSFIERILGVIRGIFQVFTGLLTGDFGKAWDGIKGIVGNALGFIRDLITNGLNFVKDFFKNTFNNILDFFRGVPGRIAAIAGGMFDGIKDAFRGAINFIIRGWNGIQFRIPGFKIGPIGYDGFTLGLPRIPELANGAIVDRPTLAMIGEKGREAVIPLTRPARAQQLMSQAGLATGGGRNGPLVSINRATFVTPMDAEAMAQKLNAATLVRAS